MHADDPDEVWSPEKQLQQELVKRSVDDKWAHDGFEKIRDMSPPKARPYRPPPQHRPGPPRHDGRPLSSPTHVHDAAQF